MKKLAMLLVIGILTCSLTACGNKDASSDSSADTETIDEVSEAEAEEIDAADIPTEEEVNEKNENAETLQDTSTEDIEAFANEIKAAVADKDIEALADLLSYPSYVAVGDGVEVDSKDDFIALGADTVFTQELCDTIAAVDVSALESSMAGIVMGDATPNIIFKSVDGTLGITGINY